MLFAGAAAAALLTPAFAQTDPPGLRVLPETVVTATRVATPIERIPAAVTVIDRETIERRGYSTLAQALAGVPGLRLRSSGGPGAETLAFIRGAETRHTLVLLNSVPVNDPSLPGGLFDFGKDTLADVERIEVVRGPMSTLYGSGAVGGVINIITRRGAERPFSVQGEIAGGAPRQARGYGFAGGRIGPLDYALGLESQSLRGSNAIADRLRFNLGERDGYRSQTGYGRLGVQAGEWLRVDGLIRQRYARYGLDDMAFFAGAFRLYDDPNSDGRDRFAFYQLGATVTPFGDRLESRLSLNRAAYTRSFRNRPDLFAQFGTLDDRFLGRRDILQFDNRLRLPNGGPFEDATLTFGAQRVWDRLETETGFSALREDERRDGLYAGIQARALGRLDLTGQVRQEFPEDFADTTTWRIGGVLQVPELSVRLRASWGTSFRAPDLYDRFGFGGNPRLEAETGRSAELGFEVDVTAFDRPAFATLGVTYFHSTIRNLIQYVGVFPTGRNENVGRAEIDGVETVLTLRPTSWASLAASLTWTDARDARTDQRLLRRPEWQASLAATLFPFERLAIAPEVLFVGRFRDLLYREDGTSAGRGLSPAGWLVNLTATYALLEHAALFVELRNLGDSDFEPTNGYQTPGRSGVVGLRARW